MRQFREGESRVGSHRRRRSGPIRKATLRSVLAAILFCCGATYAANADAPSASPSPARIRIVVFPFEIEEISAAGGAGSAPDATPYLDQATEEARRALLGSGRYTVIDPAGVDPGAAANRRLWNCSSCAAAIAKKLAADQALVGVIVRPEMVEYGAKIWIADARDGRILSSSTLPLSLGGPESWPSGVRLLLQRLMAPAKASSGAKGP